VSLDYSSTPCCFRVFCVEHCSVFACFFGERSTSVRNMAMSLVQQSPAFTSKASNPCMCACVCVSLLESSGKILLHPSCALVSGPACRLFAQVTAKIAADCFEEMFRALRASREEHRNETRRPGQVPDSQDDYEAVGFDASGRMREFFKHFENPAPGGGSGPQEKKKKKKKLKASGTAAGSSSSTPPKKFPSVDDRFFTNSCVQFFNFTLSFVVWLVYVEPRVHEFLLLTRFV